MAAAFANIRHAKKRAFLKAYALCGRVGAASESAKIDRHNHSLWLANDEEYAAAFQVADSEATQSLEDEAIRRAVDGRRVYKFNNGNPVMWTPPGAKKPEHYYEDVRSDVLIMFELNGRKPDKYRQRHEYSGPGGGPIQHQVMTPEDEAIAARIANRRLEATPPPLLNGARNGSTQ